MFKEKIIQLLSVATIIALLILGGHWLYDFTIKVFDLLQKGVLPTSFFLFSYAIFTWCIIKLVKKVTHVPPSLAETVNAGSENFVDPTPVRDPKLEKKEIDKINAKDNAELGDMLKVPVFGVSGAGKSSIIGCLVNLKLVNSHNMGVINISLKEVPPISSSPQKNKVSLDIFKNSRLSLFIITKDLTNYELEAIRFLVRSGVYVVIVLNKIDILSEKERKETFESISTKMESLSSRCELVSASVDPMPQLIIIQTPNGEEIEKEHMVDPDFEQIINAFRNYISNFQKKFSIKFLRV